MSTQRFIKIANGPLDIFNESISINAEGLGVIEIAGSILVVNPNNPNKPKMIQPVCKRIKVPTGTVIGDTNYGQIEIISGNCWYVSSDSLGIEYAVIFIFDNVVISANGVTSEPKTGIYTITDYVKEISYYKKEVLHTIPSKYVKAISYEPQDLSLDEQIHARINQGLYADVIKNKSVTLNINENSEKDSVLTNAYRLCDISDVENIEDVIIDELHISAFGTNAVLSEWQKSDNNTYNISSGEIITYESYWIYICIVRGGRIYDGTWNSVEDGIYLEFDSEIASQLTEFSISEFKYHTREIVNKIDKEYLNIDFNIHVEKEQPDTGMLPNVPYDFNTIYDDIDFTIAEKNDGLFNHYFWTFNTPGFTPNITWPNSIKLWDDDEPPIIEPYKHYEISVYNGVALYTVIDFEPIYNVNTPLTFKRINNSAGGIRWSTTNRNESKTIEYSNDGGKTWITKASNYNIDLSYIFFGNSDTIMVRGWNSTYYSDSSSHSHFYPTDDVIVYGNIMSLIDGTNFSNLNTLTGSYNFRNLFRGSHIIDASGLILPATTLQWGSYYSLFEYNVGLKIGPKSLPNATLKNQCYSNMFKGCSNLILGPDILTEIVPENTSTDYYGACYSMFADCSNLSYVKCLFTNPDNNVSNLLNNVSSTGTFVKKAGVTWPEGIIPSGWTIIEE